MRSLRDAERPPAFSGPTMTDILAGIIERDPDWTRCRRHGATHPADALALSREGSRSDFATSVTPASSSTRRRQGWCCARRTRRLHGERSRGGWSALRLSRRSSGSRRGWPENGCRTLRRRQARRSVFSRVRRAPRLGSCRRPPPRSFERRLDDRVRLAQSALDSPFGSARRYCRWAQRRKPMFFARR